MRHFRLQMTVLAAAAGLVAALLAAPASAAATAPTAEPTLTVTVLAEGLTIPWDITQAPDGTLLFTERSGDLSILHPDGSVSPVAADFGDLFAQGETGLMGVVLHPGFTQNRRFYTCQGHQDATGREIQVIGWTMNQAYTAATRVADPLVGGIPVGAAQPGRHGGCRLRFDATGALMIGTGDSATGSVPQDLTSLGGKVLRVDAITGAPAAGNPALGAPNPDTRLLYTYGHRNIQGLALRADGRMFSVEHGSFRDDEVNLVRPGRNYGWDPDGATGGYDESVPMTDLEKFPNAVEASWSSGSTTDATSGGTFLVGRQWGSWQHSLVVATLAGEMALRLSFNRAGQLIGETTIPELDGTFGRLRTVQMGTDGALYVTTSNRGGGADVILRITAS
ncbi:PQQ-dependent sugar dehydrogenase [soil metagenome]